MSIILKRPMFKKGGKTSEGTGITSNLAPRQNYQQGNVAQIIRQMGQQMRPTYQDQFRDLLTAFGASGAQDPTKLQTFGSAAGKTAANFAQLFEPKMQAAKKYEEQLGMQAIKNLTAEDKDQLIRRAKEYARIKGIPEDKAIAMFLDSLLKGSDPYLKYDSPKTRIIKKAKDYKDDGYREFEALNLGKFWVAYEDETIPKDKRALVAGNAGPGDLIVSQDGKAVFKEGIKPIDKEEYEQGKAYVNPSDGNLYLYEGKDKFRKIYP